MITDAPVFRFDGDPHPFPGNAVLPLILAARPFDYPGAYYDAKAAEDAIRFFSGKLRFGATDEQIERAQARGEAGFLRHTQGPLAGKPFILSPEQQWVTEEIFGWKRPDGTRVIRTSYCEMGRANGKSQWGAGIAGKLLYADGEDNPEIVGAASDRKQARIILNRLKAMVTAEPRLLKKSSPLRHEIRHRQNGGWYEATSADVASAWGGAPHGVVFDEIHAQPRRDLWDALVTGTGKRAQPLVCAFTTAGWDRTSLCWELHEYARQIADGEIDDPTFIGVVWAAPEEADWTDPDVWRSANPLMGVAFDEEFLAGECERAKNVPAFQNTFRTMYLSQWVGQETRFIPMDRWDACSEPVAPAKRAGFGGLDLASTTDLAAFVVVSEYVREPDAEPKVDIDLKVYAPEDGLIERARRDRVPYDVWAREGFLTLTPGRTIDQDYIKTDVLRAAEVYDLRDVGYDRWNAAKLIHELEDEGLTMVQLGQGFATLSSPTKELLRIVVEGKARHGGNPILRWMANNCAAKTDPAGNVKPDKDKSSAKIDGIVATVMGIDGLMRRGRAAIRRSAYEGWCAECGWRGGEHKDGCSQKPKTLTLA